MIYGVTILLNDVKRLRNGGIEVNTRMSEEAFFTNRNAATDFYLYHLKRWQNEKQVVYSNQDHRGRAEMYKATVMDGRIYNNGITVYKEVI